jgi:putative membrane protein
MNEAAAALGPPERLHPFSLLASLRASFKGMWSMLLAGGYFAVQGYWLLLIIMVGLFTVLSLGAAVLRWRNFAFRVGSREIRIDSGLLNRTYRSIPFDRIQDVTLEQGPLARLLGLARVRFETGGSAGANEDDGSLAAISVERAGEIRDLVRASRGLAAAPAGPAEIVIEEAPVFTMDLKRMLLAGVFNFSLAVVGGLIGLSQTMGDALGFDPFNRRFWEGLFAPGTPIGDFIQANRMTTIIAGALTLILIGLGTGILRTLLRDYGFRLDRAATGLRRRRGLFTLTDVTLPAKRTQAAIIASGPVRARFGWCELKLQSLAKEEGGKGDHVVAPLARDEEIDNVLEAIGWRPPGQPEWRRVSSAYVLAFAVLVVHLAIPAAITSLFVPVAGAAAIVTLPVLIATRFLAWRRYGYALDGDRLLVRSGWWRRRIKILPLKSIQSVDYQQIFVERWFGTASLVIGVAGGGLTGHGIKALPSETARALRDQLLSRFA